MIHQNLALQVHNLSKRIGKHEIIRDVSFDLKSGEILGLLGPNGSGKTTIIKMLVGLIYPTEGQIVMNGFDLKKEFERAVQKVGAVIEVPEMYDYLTGYDNLVHFMRMVPNGSYERIEEVIELLDMDEYIDDQVYTYSLGMRQRLGLGQAILHTPSILILDEPTNGLDPAGIKDLRLYLKKLAQEEGVSIIISSHILAEIELICDSVVVIDDGVVVEKGLIDEFKKGATEKQTFYVRLLESSDHVQEIVEKLKTSYEEINLFRAGFTVVCSEQEIAEINKHLVHMNVSIVGIEQARETLEDAFFRKVER